MKPAPLEMQPIGLRRASVTDADKVRYRVYQSPTEFIAVIAESALMAVKVSGVSSPYKIVRDLPTEGIAIEAKKMAAILPGAERIMMPTAPQKKNVQFNTEMAPVQTTTSVNFVPMGLADLQQKGGKRARILSPDMVSSMMDQQMQMVAPPPAAVQHKPSAGPAPLDIEAMPANALAEEESILEASPTKAAPTQEEIVSKLANEILPPSAPAAPAASSGGAEAVLSPDDVAKLLNG